MSTSTAGVSEEPVVTIGNRVLNWLLVVALIVGIVATALIQSSSTATAIIVGLVGGGLPVTVAVRQCSSSSHWNCCFNPWSVWALRWRICW